MRILVWQWGSRGAGPLYALNMARALMDQPDTEVFVSYSTLNEQVEGFRALSLPCLEVKTFSTMPEGILRSMALPWIRHAFREFLVSNRIDIVYCPMWHPWNAAMINVIKSLDLPFLLTVHDAHRHKGDSDWLQDRLEAFEQKHASGYITLSAHVKDQLVARRAVPADRVKVIPLAAFDYSGQAPQHRDSPTALRVLFLGRILEYKGLDILLDAYRIVRATHGDGITLAIAGAGDIGLYANALATLEGVTIVNDWLSDDDIAYQLSQADVLALSYREASQSGIVATAYGSGLPVVATPIGGLVEQVVHLETGLIADSTTPCDFAAALTQLIVEPQLLQHLSAGARQHAEESMGWHHSAELLMSFVAQFLPGKDPRSS